MPQKLIGYQKEDNFLHHLTGASKLIFFILVSVACMTTYDTRLIISKVLYHLLCLQVLEYLGKVFHLSLSL
ncbi:methionine-regulated ECF transporter [Streptococcus parauberis KRS-02083]|uniref:Methionine-regulated ECF transporter n=1 Tax=Streptococcus parauberis KRS-02083 TaxID=1207545 RepID=A0ABP2SWC4_9STRE|nr:methionine-regulated ECF transporter [Streptococcus parauberis KRS-02083]